MTSQIHPAPCFELFDPATPDGSADLDLIPHFESLEVALARLQEDGTEDRPEWAGLAIRQRDVPCLIVVCDSCGDALEDGEFGASHFDQENIAFFVHGEGWQERAGGRHLCSCCADEATEAGSGRSAEVVGP